MCTIDDALEAEEIILQDPIIARLVKERYGVTNVQEQLVADPWYLMVHAQVSFRASNFQIRWPYHRLCCKNYLFYESPILLMHMCAFLLFSLAQDLD